MDDIGDDDTFFDDGFEELPDNALYELEQKAIKSTQKPIEGANQAAKQSGAFHDQQFRHSRQRHSEYEPVHIGKYPPPSLYDHNDLSGGFLDDESLPLPIEEKVTILPENERNEVSQREAFRIQRFGAVNAQANHQQSRNYQQSLAIPRGNPYQQNISYSADEDDASVLDNPYQSNHKGGDDVAQALRAQINELLRERDSLTTELHTTKSNLITQRGEVAIIRANQGKATKTYDRQLVTLKKSIEEEEAKSKAEIAAAREESNRIATENKFLKQDLTEEAKRAKGLEQNLRDKSKQSHNGSPISTPKKTKTLALRDGFDDDDIRLLSPSKSGRTSKKGTPTQGNKRKRQQLNDSPIAPLVLSQGYDIVADDIEISKDNVPQGTAAPQSIILVRKDGGLKLLQRIYSHHPLGGSETVLELCMKYTFPSEPSRKFSTILIEGASGLLGESLASEFAKLVISIWARALKEKFYAPVELLIDVLRFIIALDSVKVAPVLVPVLLPVLQASGKVNGIPRFQHSPVSRAGQGKSKFTPKSSLTGEVNASDCLQILYDVALACSHNEDHIKLFWQAMEMDFVLIMLNSSQPINDIVLNLNVLSTSILPTTFGNILGSEDEQAVVEKHIIERVTCLLWETPRVDEGEQPCTSEQVSELRIEVMSLLSLLALSSYHQHHGSASHGSQILAQHPAAIGRLVRCIYDESAALYSPEPTRELHSMLVNEGTRLFYRLLQLHGENLDLHQKLQAVNGGVQKHAVVLTRLAFRDGPLMEEGISDETCMMAHEMLEQVITPEEAEALLEVFPTQNSRRQ